MRGLFFQLWLLRYTDGYLPGLISSVIAVVCFNFLFTYPYFELNFTVSGYPVTFLEMLGVTLLTSTMTTGMKQQARMIAEKDKLLSETEKEKMRANLLRAISHDLRTPCGTVFSGSKNANMVAMVSPANMTMQFRNREWICSSSSIPGYSVLFMLIPDSTKKTNHNNHN